MEITPDPIGNPDKTVLQKAVDEVVETWNEVASRVKFTTYAAITFIIRATDYFIRVVQAEASNLGGPDKKASVLNAVGRVYDLVVPTFMPIILKPFSRKIRYFVLNVVVSLVIDFAVNKYKSGSWTVSESASSTSFT